MHIFIKLFKNVTNFLKDHHDDLEALYYLQEIINQMGVVEKLQTLLLSIEWLEITKRVDDTFNILMLIQPYL